MAYSFWDFVFLGLVPDLRQLFLATALISSFSSTFHDLNYDRPRPMLGGRTASEVFESEQVKLPNRRKFYKEINKMEETFIDNSCSRKQKDNTRRRATQEVLLKYGLMKIITDMSTYLNEKTVTN